MKNFFLISGFLFSSILLSQNTISFGIKGGLNLSSLGGRDFLIESDNRTGFHAGFFSNIPINDVFSIQPELLYSQQGNTVNLGFNTLFDSSDPVSGPSSSVEITNKLDYISIPILALYEITSGLKVGAGPQVSYNINATTQAPSINDASDLTDIDNSDITNALDLGLVFNAQYELDFGLLLQARYGFGFLNIDSSEIIEGGLNEDSLLNRVFQVSVGYKF